MVKRMHRLTAWVLTLLMLLPLLCALLLTIAADGGTPSGETQGGDFTQDSETASPDTFRSEDYRGVVNSTGTYSARLFAEGGIRWVNTLDPTLYEQLLQLKASDVIRDVSFGTLISPLVYVQEAAVFTVEALEKIPYDVNYIKVEGTYGEWYEGTPYTFAGSLQNIRPSHYETNFVAVGYVCVTHHNGTVEYFYGNAERREGISVKRLAKEILGSETADSLNASERQHLAGYTVDPIDVGLGRVSNVYLIDDQLLFRVYDPYLQVYNKQVSLSYSGNGGWRVKASKVGQMGAESFGAAQALAYYLGEEAPADALPITLEQRENKLYVYAEDGSYVEIQKEIDFVMFFYSAAGNRVASIREIVIQNDGSCYIKGGLIPGESVYGGGRQLDAVDRIDTSIYTEDQWSSSPSSNMDIPFFTTTRGAGIYINRYEAVHAKFFGAVESPYWQIYVQNQVVDCYIFACDSIKSAIEGYTKLTGGATAPAEWAQGVMVCRNPEDLTTLDEDLLDENGDPLVGDDGAPTGRSVKTLVERMIAAGMKPTSIILEGWDFSTVSTDPASLAALREVVDYLTEKDIKVLLYMRLGGNIGDWNSLEGFAESYLLHVTVSDDFAPGTTPGTTTLIPTVDASNPDAMGDPFSYLDITNPTALEWYFDQIWGQLIELGIDGVKIDFCESLPDAFCKYQGKRVSYHWYDSGKIIGGTEHHAYPVYFITAFGKRMNELKAATGETDGFAVLSDGGAVGSQRNPYQWAGDQVRAFTTLDDQLTAVLTAGLSGVPFMTYDLAGCRYGDGTDGCIYADEGSLQYESEVLSRAIAFTAFTSAMQMDGTVRNAFELNEDARQIYRNYTALHEDLMPYINQLITEACETGIPMVRALILEYQNDRNVKTIRDQFLLGDGLLVAPILEEGATSREVYLPQGTWINLLTGEEIKNPIAGKRITVDHVNIGQIPVFLNAKSADAEMLTEIFAGDAWQAIRNFVPVEVPEETPELAEPVEASEASA